MAPRAAHSGPNSRRSSKHQLTIPRGNHDRVAAPATPPNGVNTRTSRSSSLRLDHGTHVDDRDGRASGPRGCASVERQNVGPVMARLPSGVPRRSGSDRKGAFRGLAKAVVESAGDNRRHRARRLRSMADPQRELPRSSWNTALMWTIRRRSGAGVESINAVRLVNKENKHPRELVARYYESS